MKTVIFTSLLSLFGYASIGVFCPNAIGCHESESLRSRAPEITNAPSVIVLEDRSFSTAITCTKVNGAWAVASQSEAGAYLINTGASAFNITNIRTFQSIEVGFDSLYTMGYLSGIGSKNGINIPIGVNFNFSSSAGGTTYMGASDTHTCAGAPCECCDFLKEAGKIYGCYCSEKGLCIKQAGDKCNHSVTTKE